VGPAKSGDLVDKMTALARPRAAEALEGASALRKSYLETLNLVERLHRQLLDVIKDELDRRDEREINSVQALLLFNVGDQELTAGELRTRGHYLGSNVSYNLKKLVESGYIHHERSEADRRSVLVRLTPKGEQVRNKLKELFDRHLGSLEAVGNVGGEDLSGLNVTLKRLERFWIDQVRFRL
jgi:DNA-binding MarR family transcriptional regulator